MKKYVLDTNLYIHAFRSRDGAGELEEFYRSHTPACYLSSIVLHELLVGASNPAQERRIHDEIARPFLRTGRVVAPSHATWQTSGEVIARLAREEGLDRRTLPKSFVNDVLLAISCREAGLSLVTENVRDFSRVHRVHRFDFVPPWPS